MNFCVQSPINSLSQVSQFWLGSGETGLPGPLALEVKNVGDDFAIPHTKLEQALTVAQMAKDHLKSQQHVTMVKNICLLCDSIAPAESNILTL